MAGRAGRDDAHELTGRIDGGKLFAFVRNDKRQVFRLPPSAFPLLLDRLAVSQPNGFVGRKLHAGQILHGPQRRLEKREPIVASQLAGIDGLLEMSKAADRGPLQSADITAAVPSDSARSRPSERTYVPPPQSISRTNSGYRYFLTSIR